MKLSTSDLTHLSETAIKAATVAGKMISETRPQEIRQDKDGDNLASQMLTEVDGQSQNIILETLEPTFSTYNLALLTEESPDDGSRLLKDYFWCIDPIDGTLPYIEGVPGYAVSIALVSKAGVPEIGVVYDPIEHNLYHAVSGQGAFKNGTPWNLQKPDSDIRIITDRSIAELPYCSEVAAKLGASVNGQGGAVMNAIWCLEQPPACYFKFPKQEKGGGCYWDYAATACIYHELGFPATDIHGAPLDLNRADSIHMNDKGILFATDSHLSRQIIALYRQFQPEMNG